MKILMVFLKCNVFIFFILFSLSGNASGDEVNNGGGVAERTILYAYAKLPNYIKLCLNSDFCKIKPVERTLLAKILNALPLEFASQEQIRFASEKENPGTFLIHGEIKAAKTGSKIGSPIYFNRDLFVSKTMSNDLEPLTLSNAVSLLVHEMGHHHPSPMQEADLDLMGVKVSLLLDQEIQQAPVFPNNRHINAMVIHDKINTFYPDVLLFVGDNIYDASSSLKEALYCPPDVLPYSDKQLETPMAMSRPKKVTYYNLHWEVFSEANGQGLFQMLGNLIMDCGGKNVDKSHQARITFKVSMDRGELKLVDRSIMSHEIFRPWWKIITLPFLDDYF